VCGCGSRCEAVAIEPRRVDDASNLIIKNTLRTRARKTGLVDENENEDVISVSAWLLQKQLPGSACEEAAAFALFQETKGRETTSGGRVELMVIRTLLSMASKQYKVDRPCLSNGMSQH